MNKLFSSFVVKGGSGDVGFHTLSEAAWTVMGSVNKCSDCDNSHGVEGNTHASLELDYRLVRELLARRVGGRLHPRCRPRSIAK